MTRTDLTPPYRHATVAVARVRTAERAYRDAVLCAAWWTLLDHLNRDDTAAAIPHEAETVLLRYETPPVIQPGGLIMCRVAGYGTWGATEPLDTPHAGITRSPFPGGYFDEDANPVTAWDALTPTGDGHFSRVRPVSLALLRECSRREVGHADAAWTLAHALPSRDTTLPAGHPSAPLTMDTMPWPHSTPDNVHVQLNADAVRDDISDDPTLNEDTRERLLSLSDTQITAHITNPVTVHDACGRSWGSEWEIFDRERATVIGRLIEAYAPAE